MLVHESKNFAKDIAKDIYQGVSNDISSSSQYVLPLYLLSPSQIEKIKKIKKYFEILSKINKN